MSQTTYFVGIPKLIPITATFTLPIALLHTGLCYYTIRSRISEKVLYGKTSANSIYEDVRANVAAKGSDHDQLLIASSTHSNFTENAPFALLFAAAVELNGGNRRVLAGVLSAFIAFRVAHAVGMSARRLLRWRQLGFFGTLTTLLGLAGWGAWTGLEYWV